MMILILLLLYADTKLSYMFPEFPLKVRVESFATQQIKQLQPIPSQRPCPNHVYEGPQVRLGG